MCLVLYRGTYQSSLSTVRHQESVLCLFFSFKRYQSLAEQTRQSVRPRRPSYAEIWGQAPTTLLNVPGINRHLFDIGYMYTSSGSGSGKNIKSKRSRNFRYWLILKNYFKMYFEQINYHSNNYNTCILFLFKPLQL